MSVSLPIEIQFGFMYTSIAILPSSLRSGFWKETMRSDSSLKYLRILHFQDGILDRIDFSGIATPLPTRYRRHSLCNFLDYGF